MAKPEARNAGFSRRGRQPGLGNVQDLCSLGGGIGQLWLRLTLYGRGDFVAHDLAGRNRAEHQRGSLAYPTVRSSMICSTAEVSLLMAFNSGNKAIARPISSADLFRPNNAEMSLSVMPSSPAERSVSNIRSATGSPRRSPKIARAESSANSQTARAA